MKLTRDDERARRICSLALEFMNASAPITSSDIARSHYPELSPDSFRKAFSRDREMLAACGVILAGHRAATGETLWEADDARSFAGGPELAPAEAAALELACRPLVDDPSFPLADNLRFALGKLARSFSESLSAERAAGPSTPRQVAVLRRCLTDRTPVEAHYVNAQGSESRRLLAPMPSLVSGAPCIWLPPSSTGTVGSRRGRSARIESTASPRWFPSQHSPMSFRRTFPWMTTDAFRSRWALVPQRRYSRCPRAARTRFGDAPERRDPFFKEGAGPCGAFPSATSSQRQAGQSLRG